MCTISRYVEATRKKSSVRESTWVCAVVCGLSDLISSARSSVACNWYFRASVTLSASKQEENPKQLTQASWAEQQKGCQKGPTLNSHISTEFTQGSSSDSRNDQLGPCNVPFSEALQTPLPTLMSTLWVAECSRGCCCCQDHIPFHPHFVHVVPEDCPTDSITEK